MISVGSRDGRKGLGSGMEETELEEGEACSYRDGDADSTVDPDIALSYIGEKLQKYLGHLQKDFEGGVSAENLGAKYGGYGSFLPTFQCSPSFSQTKSPAEVCNYDMPRSSRKLNLEDQRQRPFASSRASPSARSCDASGKPVSAGHFLKGKGNLQSNHVEEPALKSEAVKKCVKPSDQRTLKVRIKVGSENLSTQKNAELYNGLGLVVSPSSSLDDSSTTSSELRGKRLHVPDESPTSILEIMASYPGELHMSPLPEGLIHLTEKRKLDVKCENKHVDKKNIESCGISENGFYSSKSNQKVLELKRLKSYGKDDTVELASQKNSGHRDNGASLFKEKDIEINTSGCEELVSNALKLPFLVSSQRGIADPAKDVPSETKLPLNVPKDGVKSDIVSHTMAFPQENTPEAEKSHDLDHLQSNASEGRKALHTSGPTKSSKKLMKGGSASEGGLKPALGKSSNGGKRRQKAAQTVGTEGMCTEEYESMVKSSLPKKGGNHTNGIVSNDSHHLQKDHQRPGDRYKDIFGEADFEDDGNESVLEEMTSEGRLKDPYVFENRSLSEDRNAPKSKSNGKTSEKPPHMETHPRVYSLSASPIGIKPNTEATKGAVPLVKEDWVLCDKCKKWRLLPLGTVPQSLPRKWVCRMLNWLPGKIRCSVPQDETTNALRALYNPPASVPDATVTLAEAVGVDAKTPNHEHQKSKSTAVQTAGTNGKKVDSADFDGSTRSSNSRKRILATSENASNWNSEISFQQDACGDHQMPQLTAAVKYNDSDEEKISLANCSDTNLKTEIKQETDAEGSRASKRIKSEELHDDENWDSEIGGASSKAGDRHKYINQKDTSGEAKKTIVSCSNAKKHVPVTSDDDVRHSEKYDKESVRKRKFKEPCDSLIHADPISSSGQRYPDSADLVDELLHRKEKIARFSKSGGKDASGNKTSIGTDRKGKETKDQHNGQYPSSSQAVDCLKSDMGTEQPLVAAQSNSSKVSGSHKNKISGQKLKGSPVESVGSSPLKPPSAVKVTLTGKNLNGKDNFHASGFTTVVSPRRISGDEDEERNEQMGMVQEDRIATVDDHVTDGYNDKLHHSNKQDNVKQSSDKCKVEEKSYDDHPQNSGFHVKKSGKELSSHSKDKVWTGDSDTGKTNIKVSDLHEEKSNGRRSKCDEKSGNPSKGEKPVSHKDTAGGTSRESSRGQSQKIFGHDKQEAEDNQDRKHDIQHEHENEKLPTKSNQAEVCVSRKSNSLPPLARSTADGCDDGDTLKAQNLRKRAENQSSQLKRHPTPNSHKVRDGEAPSPLQRESSSRAANNALKEAKDLKHTADRIKNSGSTESIGIYFQAALKFLHGASLLESGSSEATKHNELMRSMHIYSSTANLCEFCAREYEKSKDMASAALAYKCMEVAYMRVVYSAHTSANKDRTELNAALQIVPSGESPSSSASDVDNLNHPATTDKAALAKAVGSQQVSGSHVITSRNRSGFLRVLNFAQDVYFAMEASRKSRIAFKAANLRLGQTSIDCGISALRKALDFNYQDVESLLRLVREAMETINR